MLEFKECDSCSSKPGSPQLCNGCYTNRQTILELNKQLEKKTEESLSFLNIRDQFALGALAMFDGRDGDGHFYVNGQPQREAKWIAKYAYRIADAMLKERKL